MTCYHSLFTLSKNNLKDLMGPVIYKSSLIVGFIMLLYTEYIAIATIYS